MTWGDKERDLNELVKNIQAEVTANYGIIPDDRLNWVQHYLDHGEYSMAFEFLYLEIMERGDSRFVLGAAKAREIGLFFELNDENECMVDAEFWPKFEAFLNKQTATS